MLAHSFLIESSSKLLVTWTGIKAWTRSISGLWFRWSIYMFFEMGFDLGTLDSGEQSLPFGLLVFVSFRYEGEKPTCTLKKKLEQVPGGARIPPAGAIS